MFESGFTICFGLFFENLKVHNVSKSWEIMKVYRKQKIIVGKVWSSLKNVIYECTEASDMIG